MDKIVHIKLMYFYTHLMLKYLDVFKNDASFLSYMVFYEAELSSQNKREQRKCIIYKGCSL